MAPLIRSPRVRARAPSAVDEYFADSPSGSPWRFTVDTCIDGMLAVSADVNVRAEITVEHVTSPESDRRLPDLLGKSVRIREWAERYESPETCGL